jgi:Protein of unknown function (DUF2917)
MACEYRIPKETTVNVDPVRAPTSIARRGVLALSDRLGHRIECLSGCLWITQDHDPRDVVLGAGKDFTLDRPGLALVYALADARLVVLDPESAS